MPMRYFEDFQVGDVFELGTTSVTEEEIIAFARQFDPQPFHIDPAQARESVFGGIIASGWHTASLFMRLLVDNFLQETVSLGSPGVDEVRWLQPLRPGDTLRARFTILEARASKSRAEMGILRSHSELFNQRDELVMTVIGVHLIGRRPAPTIS
jgi:acyl dehydratase